MLDLNTDSLDQNLANNLIAKKKIEQVNKIKEGLYKKYLEPYHDKIINETSFNHCAAYLLHTHFLKSVEIDQTPIFVQQCLPLNLIRY